MTYDHAPRATIEVWRPTHDPRYEVSNLGRVRSYARSSEPRVLRPGIASHGYPTVSFGRAGGSQCVHVLVARAFIGPCPLGYEVRHKDDDRTNARADNLEYGTRTENILDSVQRGRWNRPRKLADEDVEVIRTLSGAGRIIAKRYGVSRQLIDAIRRGRRRCTTNTRRAA